MAAKNVAAKTWSITPSFDGLRYSAYPAGDKPAGYQTSPKIVGTDIRAITLVNNYNGLGSWFQVLGYGMGTDANKGTSTGCKVFLRDPAGDNVWYEVVSYLKIGKSRTYNWKQLMSCWVQVGSLGGSQVAGRALDLKITVNGVDSNILTARMINQGARDFYFASPAGNDSTGIKNDINHPYRYVQNASGGTYLGIWASWKPGDTIVIRGNAGNWTDQLAACNNRWAQFPWGPAFPVTTGADPVGQAGAVGKGYYTFYGYPLEDVHAIFNNGGGIHGCDSARAQAGSGSYVQIANLRMETQGGSARDAGGVNFQAGAGHWQVGCVEHGPWVAGSSSVLNCSGIGGQCNDTEIIDCYVHDIEGLSDLQNHGYYVGGVSGGTGYNNATTNTKFRYCVATNCSGGSNFQFYWQEGSNSNYMTGNAMEHCYADTCAKYNYNIGDSSVSMDLFNCIGVRAGFSAVRLHPPSGQTAAINVEACTFDNWNQAAGSTTQPYCIVQEGFASTGSIKVRHNIMRGRAGRGGAYTVGWYTNNGASDTAVTASQNVYYDPDGVVTAGWSIDAAAIVGNPNFTSAATGNYTLATGSAALDAVTTARAITISDDFFGIARPQGVRDDIGACEGVGT
jgi:hypothetical protein